MVIQNPADIPGDDTEVFVGENPATYAAPTFATVGVATGVVLAANTNRRCAVIVNDSTAVIYIGIGAAAVVGSGIRVNANGGVLQIGGLGGILLTTQAINGIAGSAGNNVTVHEAT